MPEDIDTLAGDGDDILEGVEPPTQDEQLLFLKNNGWVEHDND